MFARGTFGFVTSRRSAAAWLLVLALALGGCTASRSSERDALIVFPAHGSKTAAPASQITFRGAPLKSIGAVTVTGSRSGVHTGAMRAHSDGEGASFVPDKPFEAGEDVVVTAAKKIEGVPDGGLTFTVATPVPQKITPAVTVKPELKAGAPFRSRAELRGPVLTTTTTPRNTAPGLLLMTPSDGPAGSGPAIVDETGRLVWLRPLAPGVSAADLRVQRYGGKDVLTWWRGAITTGMGFGEYVITDSTYRDVATVEAGNGYDTDLHDLRLTERGTGWIMAYHAIRWDLTSVGGAAGGAVVDSVIQEIDVKTGLVLFEWHSLDHVPLDEAYNPLPKDRAYDYFHINSIEAQGGTLLVSARNTSALYSIDSTTGALRWRLGGKKSDFTVPDDAKFGWQHDARWQPDGTITLFDNAAGQKRDGVHSAALRLRVDEKAKTVALVRRLPHPKKVLATSRGSVEVMANGNTFVGWGSEPYVTEYDPSGAVVFDARVDPGLSYRTYRRAWTGRPAAKPDVAVVKASGTPASVAVSWNGATQTATWELLTGSSEADLRHAFSTARTGFETLLAVPAEATVVAVRALDERGKTLATSAAVTV